MLCFRVLVGSVVRVRDRLSLGIGSAGLLLVVYEFIVGTNYYPWDTRTLRLNVQVINVSHSPVSSTFGFYLGQLTGQVVTIGFTAFY